jgi:hypothetical protein
MTSKRKSRKEPTVTPPSDDWSNPEAHPKMSPGLPLAIFGVLLLALILYGAFG